MFILAFSHNYALSIFDPLTSDMLVQW
jgi:hypothetical protein